MPLPTLADMVKRKKGVGLFQTGPEESQTLAQRVGAPTATSPLLAQGLGANPDQAKMAGSSANLNKSIVDAVSPDKDLATAQKRQQERQLKTQEEMQKTQQAQSLANLQNLGSRLSTLVVQSLGAGTGSATPTADSQKLSDILTDKSLLPEAESLTNKALSGTATQEELSRLAPMLGLTPTATADQIGQKIESLKADAAATIGGAAGTATSDTVTLGQLKPEDMAAIGFGSLGDLEGVLGLGAGEAAGLTVKQLQDRVAALGRENFSQVQQLQDVAGDPNRSQPERDEAIRRLRELGAVGVRATEADYGKLNQEVQGAGQVTFMGETHSLSDILSDEFLSSSVKAYLEDPNYARQLKAESPSLANFIDTNRAALEEASKALGEDVGQLAQTQAANASLGNPGGIPVDAAVNQAIFGDSWGNGFSAAPLEKTNFHRMLEDKALSESFKVSYSSLVGDIAKIDPEMARQFAGLTVQELSDAGLTTPEAIASYKEYLDDARQLQMAPTDEMAIEAAVGSLDDMNELLKQARDIENSGLSDVTLDNPLLDILDPDGNGVVDDPAAVRQRLAEMAPVLTPQDMAGGRPVLNPRDMLGKLQDQMTAGNFGLFEQIRSYMADGQVDQGEAAQLASGPTSTAELIQIADRLRATPETKASLQEAIRGRISTEEMSKLTSAYGPFDPEQLVKAVRGGKATPQQVDAFKALSTLIMQKANNPANPYEGEFYKKLRSVFLSGSTTTQSDTGVTSSKPKTSADRQQVKSPFKDI